MSFNALTPKTATTVIYGGGFWPDLEVAEFQALYRMPSEYAESLVADHIELAFIWAVKQLVGWQEKRQEEGFLTLADCFLSDLPGLPGKAEKMFKRAVFCHAKALLLEQFATIERREAARHDAREAPEITDIFYAQANRAIADILGTSNIVVSSI